VHERVGEMRGAETLIAIDLPTMAEGTVVAERAPEMEGVPPDPGGSTTPRLDTGHAGAGGDTTVDKPAINFSDGDERMRLSPDMVSRLDRDQLQRLDVGRTRKSWDDRRATTHPMELTFIASGPGKLEQRRPVAASDPSRGALVAPSPDVKGSDVGVADQVDDGERSDHPGGERRGSIASASGLGVPNGRPGRDHRVAASVASGRPAVTQGPVAVNANDKGRVKDNADTEQEVATTVNSLVHASTSGGKVGDSGRGGSGGGGAPGAGGTSGAGSEAQALGLHDGQTVDMSFKDPRVMKWLRQVYAKLWPLWANAFPKSALFDLKQGTVIFAVNVDASGAANVAWPPLRPSGIPEFDKNVADAIRRGVPFPPIPSELGVRRLRVVMPFTMDNPVVK
jgi:TonB family protein